MPAMSFLAIDVGNTRLKWALYESARAGVPMLSHGAVFLENIDRLGDQDWRHVAAPASMLGCCVAGDAVRHRVQEQLELWDVAPSWVVSSAGECGVVNGYDHPTRLGADRWVAVIGAWHRLRRAGLGQPLLVMMVGTAVTVDAVDANGRFLGGFILPGHGIMLRALESGTAGLHVPTGEVRDFPTNTSDALTSGGTFAIAGAVERMHRNIQRHCGQAPHCVVTGGAGWKMAPYLSVPFDLVESLIFDGLLAIAESRQREREAGLR